MGLQLAEKNNKVSAVEGDLRIEREWRQSLQESVIVDKDKISQLNEELKLLKNESQVNMSTSLSRGW